MYAVFAVDTSRANQFEVSLIGQGGRLQCVASLAAYQMPPGDSAEFRIDQGQEAVERQFIALTPGGNQTANVSRRLARHSDADLTTKNSALVTLFPVRSRNTGQEET